MSADTVRPDIASLDNGVQVSWREVIASIAREEAAASVAQHRADCPIGDVVEEQGNMRYRLGVLVGLALGGGAVGGGIGGTVAGLILRSLGG